MKKTIILLFLSANLSHGSWFSKGPVQPIETGSFIDLVSKYPWAAGLCVASYAAIAYSSYVPDEQRLDLENAITGDKHIVKVFQNRLDYLGTTHRDIHNKFVPYYDVTYHPDHITFEDMKTTYTGSIPSFFDQQVAQHNKYALAVPGYLITNYKTEFTRVNKFKQAERQADYVAYAQSMNRFNVAADRILEVVKRI